jgi:DNA (cytosine-5)-methyltransferase 1
VIHDTSGQFSIGDVTDKPCNSITTCSSHWSIQDIGEKRKLTIDELKRICAFPDDFQLTGSYAKQWERLGRSVPPVMMSHIAIAIRDEVLAHVKYD